MAELGAPAEKISLSSSAKKQVRYGSMAKESSMKLGKVIKHSVQSGDTLQGLALRYGVTMEQIKRANKMWTTDSLFLRPTLDIPVFTDFLNVSSLSSQPMPDVTATKQTNNHKENYSNVDSTNHNTSDQLSASVVEMSDKLNLEKEETAADFLIRIDSHIAQSKDKVLKLQKKTNSSESDLQNSKDNFPQSYQYQRNNLMGSSSLSDLTLDPSLPPQPVVMTQGRKVRSSLRKLEREQDEIFEL